MNRVPTLSVVIIGRNEGERLARCLQSVAAMQWPRDELEVIYADSQSEDESAAIAYAAGATVISVAADRHCAAAGRNAGWRVAQSPIVLFLDGDTLLDQAFAAEAMRVFKDPQVAVVWGNRRELNPRASIYNRALDLGWISRHGLCDSCGGDALIRRDVLQQAGGYDEHLLAGEEADLCRRIRALGYRIWHIDRPMTRHDLAMTHWRQYWRRAIHTGYGCAEVAERYRSTSMPLWTKESQHNLMHGPALMLLLAAALVLAIALKTIAPVVATAAIVAALILGTAWRCRWKSRDIVTLIAYGFHSHLQQIPIFFGQLKYWRDSRRGRLTSAPAVAQVPGQQATSAPPADDDRLAS